MTQQMLIHDGPTKSAIPRAQMDVRFRRILFCEGLPRCLRTDENTRIMCIPEFCVFVLIMIYMIRDCMRVVCECARIYIITRTVRSPVVRAPDI